jgi:hypothetical protein
MEKYTKNVEAKGEEKKSFNIKYAKNDLMTLTSKDYSSELDTRLSCKWKHEHLFTSNHFSSDDDCSDKEVNENGVTSLKQKDYELLSFNESDDNDFGCEEDVHSDTSGCSDEEGPEESAVRWKANLAQKAADAFLERQSTTHNLWKLVYGKLNGRAFYLPCMSYLHEYYACFISSNKIEMRLIGFTAVHTVESSR